jgi:hypothetical protein
LVKKLNKEFTLIDSNTTSSSTQIDVGIPDNISDVMVCYGTDNNGQAYGGGIIYGNKYMAKSKPCFLQVLMDQIVVGVVYINFTLSALTYYIHSGDKTIRVIIYGR